jgi:hypothetical protein
MTTLTGTLEKMKTELNTPVQYSIPIGNELIALNEYIGQPIKIAFEGKIICQGCAKPTKKSYSQGYCYLCCQRLARCDMCILKPEQCHHHLGTCREPEWGETHCMIEHAVYLANTSGLKVGITRHSQMPTRWIDQGAQQALVVARTSSRRIAGYFEVVLAQHISDKTNWRQLLKAEAQPIDLAAKKVELLNQCAPELAGITAEFGADAFKIVDEPLVTLGFPVRDYPEKVTSIGLDKRPMIEGVLTGIKGQYLYLGHEVFNVRKHTGYRVSISVGE